MSVHNLEHVSSPRGLRTLSYSKGVTNSDISLADNPQDMQSFLTVHSPDPDSLSLNSTGSRASSCLSWISAQWGPTPRLEDFIPPTITHRLASEIMDCTPVDRHELRPNDFIIAVMGPTGAGKSTLISCAIGRDCGVGSTLQSFTSQVSAIRINFPDGFNVVLVDTPGFDDTFLSDLDILKLISDWLRGRRKQRIQLVGLLYLHRISDNRMGGTPLKNLALFQKLCGNDRFDKVILVTTMWSQDQDEAEVESEREEELKENYWKLMIERGSGVRRFEGTSDSVWEVINELVRSRRQHIQVQRELDPDWKDVPETAAGRELHNMAGALVKQQEEVLRRIQTEVLKTKDPQAMEALFREYVELGRKRENALREMQELNPSIFSRIYRRIRKQRISFPYQERCEALFQGILKRQDLADRVDSLTENSAREMTEFVDKSLCVKGIPAPDESNAFLLLQRLILKARQYPSSFLLQHDALHIGRRRSQVTYHGTLVRVMTVPMRCPNVREILSSVYSFQQNILPLYNISSYDVRRDRYIVPQHPTIHDYFELKREKKQEITYDEQILLISDVLDGLSYLHQLNVVHGSLRAKNVFVCESGRAMIASSNLVAPEDRKAEFPVRWAAPELLGAPQKRTLESDIWSFGCFCYEILTKRLPFYEHKQAVSVYNALRDGELPGRPEKDTTSDKIWNWMTQCWAQDPTQRPTCKGIRSSFPHQSVVDEDSRAKEPDLLRQKLHQARSSVEVNYENIYNLILYLLRINVKKD